MNPLSVFLSSTGRDLHEYRAAAIAVCNELGLVPVAMEFWESMGVGATEGSLAKLDGCQVFVGFLAQRYGYIEDGHDRSVTELEFAHAAQRGLTRLCFLLDPKQPWPTDAIDYERHQQLVAFKRQIEKSILNWFTTVADFKLKVFKALSEWKHKQAPPGPPVSAALLTPPRQLPSPPADFIGREEALQELEQQIAGGATISGVRGLGGVGKTTLALKLAERLAERYPDGQIYLDLKGASAEPLAWQKVAEHVLHSFHPEERLPASAAALQGRYRSLLAGKRVLLFLDNSASREQVEPLLPPAGVLLLLTSRQRFRLPGQYPLDLDTLPAADAVVLLRRLASRLSEADAAAIAQECGYLPLALRLAGSLLAERRDLSPVRFRERLRQTKLQTLDEVTASLRLSEETLPEPVRSRWVELAVLVGGFELSWGAAVWDVDEQQADAWLAVLMRASLLDWDEDKQFYRLHDLVHEYAANGLTQERRREVARRHARCFCQVVCAAEESFLKGGTALLEGLQRFDRVWPNARAGFAWLAGTLAQDDALASLLCRLVNGSRYVRHLRQHPQEQIPWLESAVQAARQIHEQKEEGLALGNLGLAYRALGQLQQAIDFYEQHLTLAREIGDRHGESQTLSNMGRAYTDLGQPSRAIDFCQQSLTIAREIDDRRGEGHALAGLGWAYTALGQSQRAIDLYQQHLTIAQEIGDRRGEGNSLGSLGLAYAALGQPQRAIEFHEQHLSIAREIGDRRGEGNALGNLAGAYSALGQPHRASDLCQQRLTIVRELGDRQGEANASWNLGLQLVKLERLEEVIALMEVCVRFEQEIGHADAEKHAAHVAELRQRLTGQDQDSPG